MLAACLALCAHAEVYKWVDEKGRTQHGETPPAGKEERSARCEFERAQQKVLDADAPILYKDEKGVNVPLDEAKREEAKERVRDNVTRYCS